MVSRQAGVAVDVKRWGPLAVAVVTFLIGAYVTSAFRTTVDEPRAALTTTPTTGSASLQPAETASSDAAITIPTWDEASTTSATATQGIAKEVTLNLDSALCPIPEPVTGPTTGQTFIYRVDWSDEPPQVVVVRVNVAGSTTMWILQPSSVGKGGRFRLQLSAAAPLFPEILVPEYSQPPQVEGDESEHGDAAVPNSPLVVDPKVSLELCSVTS